MSEGRDHMEMVPSVVESVAEHYIESRPVASFAKIKRVTNNGERAEIELLHDPSAQTDNVPITVPFGGDGFGQRLPVEAGMKGVVLFMDHPVEGQLVAEGGHETDEIGMDIEDAVFIPASFRKDNDESPPGDEGDWVWEHPNGSRIEMGNDGSAYLRNESGSKMIVDGIPEQATEESGYDGGEGWDQPSVPAVDAMGEIEQDLHGDIDTSNKTEYPVGNPGESFAQLSHPSGLHVTITKRGVALGDDRSAGVTEVVSGKPNDGERRELDGHHQHFHLVEHGNDEYSIAGPQLSFREFIAWMTDDDRQARLRNSGEHEDAREYAENYLGWLEGEVGREIDPTDEEDWPEPEPMATPEQREEFNNDI